MFFELRQYHIHPGQQKAWVKCMEEEIIPFQVKMGRLDDARRVLSRLRPLDRGRADELAEEIAKAR